MTAEANCDCDGFPLMQRLHVASASRFYLCQKCGAVREDVYQHGAITRQIWHDSPGTLSSSGAARREAERALRIARTEQLELF